VTDPRLGLRSVIAHARHVPASERARLGGALRDALSGHGLVVETCHRVEGYAAADDAILALDRVSLPEGGVALEGQRAIRHAVAMATGRDSVVVGEDQVLHQLREAVDAARRSGGLDPVLERLFATALHAGRRARSWSHRPTASVATLAFSEVERRIGPIRDRPVLVVGAGRMGRLVARAAATAGAAVTVANRTPGGAAEVAAEIGGRAAPFDPGVDVGAFRAIVIALGGPWGTSTATNDALGSSTAIVVDLSVPTALDAGVGARLADRYVTGDDLARLDAPRGPSDTRHLARLDALVDRTTLEFMAWLEVRGSRATAAALASRVDEARAAELDTLWRQLPDLEPEARARIEAMTRHLAARLLREPMERLGKDADGRTERAVREVFAL
jgi:glutamyl-tRNA reductase